LTLDRIKAVLLDLDDTLLINDMETFSPPYFRALLAKVQGVCRPGTFVEALNSGIRAMVANDGRGPTNAEVFDREFYPRVGCPRDDIEPLLNDFYRHDFEDLAYLTAPDPAARELVSLLRERGIKIAIATQPIFPLSAIHTRLRWANVSAEEFGFDLITSYEVMAACKPRRAFFESVLRQIGCRASESLMVGDSIEMDMPAGRMGLRTFWVDRNHSRPSEQVVCDAHGSLYDLITLLKTEGASHDV
jgi:FMN phosphatase YigB (HAD superfamily)